MTARTGTINASDEWWKDHVKKYPSHKKWCTTSPSCLSELECMFDKAYVTGVNATSTGALNLDSEGGVAGEHDEDVTPQDDPVADWGPPTDAPQNPPSGERGLPAGSAGPARPCTMKTAPCFACTRKPWTRLVAAVILRQ